MIDKNEKEGQRHKLIECRRRSFNFHFDFKFQKYQGDCFQQKLLLFFAKMKVSGRFSCCECDFCILYETWNTTGKYVTYFCHETWNTTGKYIIYVLSYTNVCKWKWVEERRKEVDKVNNSRCFIKVRLYHHQSSLYFNLTFLKRYFTYHRLRCEGA